METREGAEVLGRLVVARAAHGFEVVVPPVEVAEILFVYFQPPGEWQEAEEYRDTVLVPVAEALATALEPWQRTVELPAVIGAASCTRVTTKGLAVRVTESRAFDERVYPQGRVEWRAEVGVAE